MKNLLVSYSPHIRDRITSSRIMLDVVIALIPAFIASVLIFGWGAALVTGVCVLSCVFFEWAFEKATKRTVTTNDFSTVVTGMLLAFNLPVDIPLWQAVFGCAVAIIVVKQLFGGLGKNFANPAITARILMMIAFSSNMTNWVRVDSLAFATPIVDSITSPTPLAILTSGEHTLPSYLRLFLGIHGGSLGETCAFALLLGGLYLLYRRVITWHTPVAFMGTVFILCSYLGQDPIYHLLAGGLFLGAFFMATDYPTTPQTHFGRLVFGIGCGVFTVLIRIYGTYPEGVAFSILIMNMVVPYINIFTMPKALGGKET